jgi:AcrR family transcriptional regulator
MSETATRPYHHGNLREELLDRAEAIVRERGVAELSLRELARDAGVSHAAPRRHFDDRQALLDALALRGFARLGAELSAAVAGRAGYQTRLARTASAYVRFATRDAALLELMFAGKHREPAGPLHDAAEEAFATVLALIADGQQQGQIAGSDPHTPGMAFFAMLQGLAAFANGGMLGDIDIDTATRNAIRGLMKGLAPR